MSAVLITGASKGIGEACSLRLARAGHTVFAGVRDQRDGEALRARGGERITPLQLDVTSAAQITEAAAAIALRVELLSWGIQVVVVEPGVIATPIWETSIESAERIMPRLPPRATEYYGHIFAALTQRVREGARRGLPADRVAEVVEQALFSRKPRTRYVVGRDARARLLLQKLPDRWRDRIIARRLK